MEDEEEVKGKGHGIYSPLSRGTIHVANNVQIVIIIQLLFFFFAQVSLDDAI